MVWALGAIAMICVGLPVIAWLATRGLARRPPTPLKPYHEGVDSWIHRQYDLDWPECSLIRGAVARGSRVADPVLEDAAHRLAAATLSGKVPGGRLVLLAAGMNVMMGLGFTALGIGSLFSGESQLTSVLLIPEGVFFLILGWFRYVHGPGRQRKNALRAPELNQPWRTVARDLRPRPRDSGTSSSEPGDAALGHVRDRGIMPRLADSDPFPGGAC